jgi:hypothetical protein
MVFLSTVLLLAGLLPSSSQNYAGFEWNKKSTLVTEKPVEFPGVVLAPGTYTVRLKEAGERRSTVEILNQDESQVMATILAVPDHRTRPEDGSEFTFHQVQRDGPQPVQSWFYAGDLVGLEFVYAKIRAREIAKDSDAHVMASNGMKDAVIVAVTPNGKEVVIDGAPEQTARRKSQ